ncbi:MAG: ExbD/TolR family protein [Rubrivivax sp.]|nr:biopolymer transporter ExbD [Rubrivivax sp.]
MKRTAAHLEITAFINLIVVLVPFLLSTAVFSRLAVMELKLPAPSTAEGPLAAEDLKLEVVIRKNSFEVGDRIGGLFATVQRTATGGDAAALKELNGVLVQVKARWPQAREATVLSEPDTPYDHVVQVMEQLRSTVTVHEGKPMRAELFPLIAVGDAPLRARS